MSLDEKRQQLLSSAAPPPPPPEHDAKPSDEKPPPRPRGRPRGAAVAASPSPTTVHRSQDRGSADDDASRLPMYARFQDLRDAGITQNWTHSTRLIDEEGFPPGILLSRNIRAWDIAEVRRWLADRPVARKIITPPKTPGARKRQEAA